MTGGLLLPQRLMGVFGGGVTVTGGVEGAFRISSLLREPNEIASRPLKSVGGGVAESDGEGAGAGAGKVDDVDGTSGDGRD